MHRFDISIDTPSILDRCTNEMRPTCRFTVDREPTDFVVEPPLMSADVSTVTISVGYRSPTGGLSVNYRPICRPILMYGMVQNQL